MLLGDAKKLLSEELRNKLYSRYEESDERSFLTDKQLNSILNSLPLEAKEKANIKRIYGFRQQMLFRGQFITVLKANPDNVISLFVKTAFKNGVDIFRVFEAFNNPDSIIKIIREVRKYAGAKLQPCIQYTTNFPLGIPKYVELAKRFIVEAGPANDSLTIKDASGVLEARESLELLQSLRKAKIKENIQLHTHDTYGNRGLTLLWAIIGNGSHDPITLDLSVKGLSHPSGQVEARKFSRLLKGTRWEHSLGIDEDALQSVEKAVGNILSEYKAMAITTQERFMTVFGGVPGGMASTFDVSLKRDLPGYSRLLDPRAGQFAPVKDENGAVRRVQLFNENKEFTKDGQKFFNAVKGLIFTEIPWVKFDLGEISLVTPTSQWAGSQALSNVLIWLKNGWLDLEDQEGIFHLKKNEHFPISPFERYKDIKLDKYAVQPSIIWSVNYILENPELKEMYGAWLSPELVKWVTDISANGAFSTKVPPADFNKAYALYYSDEEVLNHVMMQTESENVDFKRHLWVSRLVHATILQEKAHILQILFRMGINPLIPPGLLNKFKLKVENGLLIPMKSARRMKPHASYQSA